MKNKKPQKTHKVRNIAILCLAAIIVAVGVFFLCMKLADKQSETTEGGISNINYNDPTDEQIESGESIKEQNQTDEDNQEEKNYTIFISGSGQYDQSIEVRAYIGGGLIENDGICKFVFKNGNRTLTKNTPAYANVSNTNCENLEVPASDFPISGDWSLIITYSSATTSLSSDSVIIEVSK